MNNKKFIYIFLLILPILDLITSLTTRFQITTFSIGVIVKTLFLGLMVLYLIFKSTSKHKKKSLIYLGIILVYVIGYFITKLKYLNISTFIVESMYMVKLLFYPILLACLLCYFDDKKISKQDLINVLVTNLLTYILLLILPLLTKSSFNTYLDGLEGHTGWFYAANEISIILILLFPFMYSLFKHKNIFIYLIPIIVILTMSTIGTKASMLGLIIDTLIIFLLSIFIKGKTKKTNKRIIIITFGIFLFTSTLFYNSNSLTNFQVTLGLQQIENIKLNEERIKQRELLNQEIEKIEKEELEKKEEILNKENNNNEKDNDNNKDNNQIITIEKSSFEKFLDEYGRAILSDRDLYVMVTYKLYKNNFDINTLLFGLGYTNNVKYHSFGIEKLIEIDPLDIYFHSGFIAIIIVLLPFLYFVYNLILKRKISVESIFYSLMLGMTLCVSCVSGHTLMAPAVSVYLVLYFILAYHELGLIDSKKKLITNGKVSIYALHLNYGGIEKNICTKANMLSKLYDVEIISLYKLTNKPVFNLNKNIKVTYLTNNIKPNKQEFIKAIKNKKFINFFKEGLYAIKILYLKSNLITKSMIECDSEIIISTRIEFTKKLLKCNEYNNIKIAEEHVYHNNNKHYLNNIYKVLKKVNYLMPSSDYLSNYYKELFPKYSYKIKTNKMPIETDNSISNLKNKKIISVGRLSKEKGYKDLINIFNKLDNKDWTLQIVGNGPEYNNLNNQINALGLEKRIKLLGTKSSEELNKLYNEASIYLMTSYEESFGLVLLEAASHGLPIVAYSSALGAKEILNNNGILIDDRKEKEMIDKLNELISDIKKRKKYQKKSLLITQKYDIKIIENHNREFYSKIKKTNLFNNLYTKSKKDCFKLLERKLKRNEKTFIITSNPETYMISVKDEEMNNILNNKDNLVIPDGIAVVKACKLLDINVAERIAGIDIAEYLIEECNKQKKSLYLLGAKEEVIETLAKKIKKEYKNINLLGYSNGYVKDKDKVFKEIIKLKPDVCLVALGIPHQEKLIYKHLDKFDKGIFVGVGGSFDVMSGTKKRAPKLFIKLNLEWFYRILCEPKRLKRFWDNNIKFILKIKKESKK